MDQWWSLRPWLHPTLKALERIQYRRRQQSAEKSVLSIAERWISTGHGLIAIIATLGHRHRFTITSRQSTNHDTHRTTRLTHSSGKGVLLVLIAKTIAALAQTEAICLQINGVILLGMLDQTDGILTGQRSHSQDHDATLPDNIATITTAETPLISNIGIGTGIEIVTSLKRTTAETVTTEKGTFTRIDDLATIALHMNALHTIGSQNATSAISMFWLDQKTISATAMDLMTSRPTLTHLAIHLATLSPTQLDMAQMNRNPLPLPIPMTPYNETQSMYPMACQVPPWTTTTSLRLGIRRKP